MSDTPLLFNATGGVPVSLCRRTLFTRVQTRLTAALVIGVVAVCLLPFVTALFALETTLYRYGTLFYIIAAVMLAAGAAVIGVLLSRRRAALGKALERDPGDTPRVAAVDDEGITVTAAYGASRVAFADITRVYETREGLLLYCLSLHLWLPSAHLTAQQCKALLAAVYQGLPATAERCVLGDMEGGRLSASSVQTPEVPEPTLLTAPYADVRAASGKDTRVLADSALGGVFIGCAAATLVFPRDPLLPAAICAVAGLTLLYALLGGIARVSAASLLRKQTKKQVYAVCTVSLSDGGCAVYADGVLLQTCPLSAVTVAYEDGAVKLTADREVYLFPETEIPQHLLERMNISHG